MQIAIDDEKILFDSTPLDYYPYYFAIWDIEIDHRITVKKVLAQWASALETLIAGSVVYLPFDLNDQVSKALKAELNGQDIVLTIIDVAYDGWALDLDDLSDFMCAGSNATFIERSSDLEAPKHFGTYGAKSLMRALKDAQIMPVSA